MRKIDYEKDAILIKQYLYEKLSHISCHEFYLNFSNLSCDLRPFIESNYYDYINVNYIDVKDLELDKEVSGHFTTLNRSYINKYTWIKREELLNLLKEESKDPSYSLSPSIKNYLLSEGMEEKDIDKITNKWIEFKTLNAFSFPKNKDCINAPLATKINEDIAPKIATLNLNSDFNYDFHLSIKSKKKKNYYYGRAYSSTTFTKNDIEEKKINYWDKVVEDEVERECRSAVFSSIEKEGYFIIDLGDMSSSFPNVLNCIKTGRYEDIDFHSRVASLYGIDRSIAKMSAVRCCFNCRKVDILYGLLDKVDCEKITNEIKEMEESGVFIFKNKKILLNRGRKVRDAHEFFSSRKENIFFKYCNDFLTSYDACHEIYRNDLAPSDLSLLTSAIEINVIYDAYKKGFKIVNAFDHAYLITKNKEDWYDWKGEYAKTAERLVELYFKDYEKEEGRKTCRRSIARLGVGFRNALKEEVRNWIKEHDYDIDAAAKHFNWYGQEKYYWKQLIKKGKI